MVATMVRKKRKQKLFNHHKLRVGSYQTEPALNWRLFPQKKKIKKKVFFFIFWQHLYNGSGGEINRTEEEYFIRNLKAIFTLKAFDWEKHLIGENI